MTLDEYVRVGYSRDDPSGWIDEPLRIRMVDKEGLMQVDQIGKPGEPQTFLATKLLCK